MKTDSYDSLFKSDDWRKKKNLTGENEKSQTNKMNELRKKSFKTKIKLNLTWIYVVKSSVFIKNCLYDSTAITEKNPIYASHVVVCDSVIASRTIPC